MHAFGPYLAIVCVPHHKGQEGRALAAAAKACHCRAASELRLYVGFRVQF